MDPDKQAMNTDARFFHWQFGDGRCEYDLRIRFEDGTSITVLASVPARPGDPIGAVQTAALDRAAAALDAASKLGADGIAARLSPDWSVTEGGT